MSGTHIDVEGKNQRGTCARTQQKLLCKRAGNTVQWWVALCPAHSKTNAYTDFPTKETDLVTVFTQVLFSAA